MYIFVDGTEVDGIQGLTESLKYLDKSTTAYEIIIEGTQNSYESSYYNSDILGCLTQLGFYGDDTKVEHVESTGLMSKDEIEKVLHKHQASKRCNPNLNHNSKLKMHNDFMIQIGIADTLRKRCRQCLILNI